MSTCYIEDCTTSCTHFDGRQLAINCLPFGGEKVVGYDIMISNIGIVIFRNQFLGNELIAVK